MQRLARQWQAQRLAVAFVPTMGYFHDGHLSLIARARRAAGSKGKVVVSIYVNPTQFAPGEDLARYPRDFQRDKLLCARGGADVIFVPTDAQMYPDGFNTFVVEEELGRGMEGESRPNHFRGVTTVVAKLFNIVLPTVAIFGAKDFQQAAIIKKMTADLNFPLKIIVAPTRRERDGLAMSSRNKYLTPSLRRRAVVLWLALQRAQAAVCKGPVPAKRLKADLARFIAHQPEAKVDYIEIFDPHTLAPARQAARGLHLALAVYIGSTRLIDNVAL